MATYDTMNSSTCTSAPISTFSVARCVAILHYFSCSCRSPHPIYFCRDPKCRHEQPQLHISPLPFACSSRQVENNRFWHYANKTRANRSSACSAEDPALSGFAREEDTALAFREGEVLVLESLEGLCGDHLGQVVPPYAENWREKVVAKYENLRDEVVGTSKGVGVIGGERPVKASPGKQQKIEEDAHSLGRVEEAQAPVETSDMEIPTPDETVAKAPVECSPPISEEEFTECLPEGPTPADTPTDISSRLSLDTSTESAVLASEPKQAEETSLEGYSPIVEDDDDVVGFLLDDTDDYFEPKVAPPPAPRGILGRMLSSFWGSGEQ